MMHVNDPANGAWGALEKMNRVPETLSIAGDTVCYVKVGRGSPLVFVHGWGADHAWWEPQLSYFSQFFTVIAYDLIGVGCSAGGNVPYKFQLLLDQLDGIIVSLCEGQRPVIVGHSLGGSVVLHYAAENAGRVAALVNVASSLPYPKEQQEEADMFAGAVDKYGLGATTGSVSKLLWSDAFRLARPEVESAWRARYASYSAVALLNLLRAWAERPNPLELLNRITFKTQHIMGTGDTGKSVNSVERLSRLIPGSVFEIIEGAGHMSFVEKPDEFNRRLARFLGVSPPE